MAVDGIGGIGPGQVPADPRALAAEVALNNVKQLTAALTPGEILTARVSAALGDGNVALTVRGQTLVATSATPLQQDTLVKLLVQSSGDQPVLRIIAAGASPNETLTTTPAARVLALGLPSTAVATLALQAFEQVGAPLDPVRLKETVAQLESLPPAQVPQRAQALALLAQAGLPATPPFIALAERSATGTLPNPAAALADLQRLVQPTNVPQSTTAPQPTAVSQVAIAPQSPDASTPLSAILPDNAGIRSPAVNPSSVTANQVVATSDQLKATSTPSVVSTPPTSITSQVLERGVQSVNVSVQAGVTNALAPLLADSTSDATPAPAPAASASATSATAIPNATRTSATVGAASSSAPISVSAAPPTSAAATPISQPSAAGSPVPATAAPAATIVVPQVPVTLTLAGMPVPDLGRGGANAVLQALALAGVRPRETGEVTVAKSAPTLLHRLDVPVEETDPIRATVDSTTRHPQQPQIDAAIAHVMREQAAETVVKPQALVDYDLVLGLPLQVNGQPMPARLAVAERKTSAGTATFLRVDAELTHLGPLSVRISGIDGGPMAITVLGVGPALGALTEALPDLNESLRALGLTAGVRVGDLMEDLDHG
jgi:hypothetical protein